LIAISGLLGSAENASAQEEQLGTCTIKITIINLNNILAGTTVEYSTSTSYETECKAPKDKQEGNYNYTYEKIGWRKSTGGIIDPVGNCTVTNNAGENIFTRDGMTEKQCSYENLTTLNPEFPSGGKNYLWKSTSGAPETIPVSQDDKTAFETFISGMSCGLNPETWFGGCLVHLFYVFAYTIPAFILYLSAYFFNILIAVSLSSKLFADSEFIKTAWGIVRDLSNIFFILILLYVAIKIILDMGASDAKKIIPRVVVVALLINFSMFFTGIVIDSSNILALVFYNKLQVDTKNADETPRDYTPPFPSLFKDKDVAGGMVASFDPTRLLDGNFFKTAGNLSPFGTDENVKQGEVSVPLVVGVLLLTGALMYFAAYCFFVAGFAFVGRLVELWVLIIASPFAFMSSVLPEMAGIKDWGWKAWLHRLLTASFMAAAFMFFLYFIFLLIKANPFADFKATENVRFIQRIMEITLPAILILILLLKSLKLAKLAAGQMGEAVMKYGEKLGGAAAGLALGAATGGAATLARASVGRVAENLSERQGFKDWAAKNKLGAATLKMTRGVASSSFDARAVKIGGKDLAGATGLKLGEAQKGGFTKSRKDYVEKEEKFASSLEMSERERYERGLVYTGDEEQDREIKRRIDTINRERTLARAQAVEGRGRFAANTIAATKIREASKNKANKIRDALAAIAAGGGAAGGGAAGGGAAGGGAAHP